ncbi:MAG TPA: type II toxin-antitoxin system VapC family toxin [Stellaceae bacterium]|nr:type II toxin-antitoxin system VapC family toxin [Stellaceae bacterium]
MAVKIVDASALAAVVFAEPDADRVAQQLADAILTAPALLQFELTNICRTKLRQFPGQRDILLDQFSIRSAIAVETREIDHDEAPGLAERFGLSAYDASYLWLAREFDAQRVTLDQRLARAATLF